MGRRERRTAKREISAGGAISVRLPSGEWLRGWYEPPRARRARPLLHVRLADALDALGADAAISAGAPDEDLLVRIPSDAIVRAGDATWRS